MQYTTVAFIHPRVNPWCSVFDHIDAIIGLPSNIFFGTGIPTVILVLKQKRQNTNVLIVDASKYFIKEGKNNKLQTSGIKRIVDAVTHRDSIEKFSQLVSRQTLQDNGYNLNIPRYVNSSAAQLSWDLHATMLGGIPNSEIAELQHYWQSFPQLHSVLFMAKSSAYSELVIAKDELNSVISNHPQVLEFIAGYNQTFEGFDDHLNTILIQAWQDVKRNQQETEISTYLFARLSNMDLINKYQAYQYMSNQWQIISADLEMMQTEGFTTTKQVDPNIMVKKEKGKDTEAQDANAPWKGHIMPFELVQATYLSKDLDVLQNQEAKLAGVISQIKDIIESFTEEEKDSSILNDKNDAFVRSELSKKLKEIYSDVDSEEIRTIGEYVDLLENKAKKPEKLTFIETHKQVNWNNIEANKDGTYSKGKINSYLQTLRAAFEFDPETFEGKVVKADQLLTEQAELKADIKEKAIALHLKTKTIIEGLSDEQVDNLLHLKWITPLSQELASMPNSVITQLISQVQALADKYAVTYSQVANEIKTTEEALADMVGELAGNECDLQGLNELTNLLKGA